jgi:hypothetical protein
MKFPRRAINGDEQDAYTSWRRVMFWQSGELKRIKRRTHKRERREAKSHIIKESRESE